MLYAAAEGGHVSGLQPSAMAGAKYLGLRPRLVYAGPLALFLSMDLRFAYFVGFACVLPEFGSGI